MRVFRNIGDLREYLSGNRGKATIGLVPTMGAFHQGHLSLMSRAAGECEVVVVSVFVNPIQFGAGEDFEKYPRDIEKDISLAASAGADAIFAPDNDEMYPVPPLTFVNVNELSETLCGESRSGHFKGVAIVVAKLLNIVQPDKIYLGEKDWQQLIIVKRMIADLNFPVELVTVPTVRDEDGLAMSSRNDYLSPGEKKEASIINRSLKEAAEVIRRGETDPFKVRELVENMIDGTGEIELEYFSICRPFDLTETDRIERPVLLAIAVRLGSTRLIDNVLIN